jgi:hypothetical protein
MMRSPRHPSIGISRRALLRGFGLSPALYPFLPLLNASGQEVTRPKRLLIVYSPDGSPDSNLIEMPFNWKPQGTETSFTLSAIHAPLAPFQSKLVIPWGLKMSAKGAGEQHAYGMAGAWSGATLHGPQPGADFDGGNGNRTGWGGGPTIDQAVAAAFGPALPYQRAPDDANQETPYRTLELGVQSGNPTSVNRMIYKADSQPLHPETSPKNAFTRLFGGAVGDPAALAKKKAEKAAILDLVKGDIARLRGRVSSEDYPKIDAHLEGIRALEQRLDATTTATCSAAMTPPGVTSNNANYPSEVASMIDIAAHALACDLTRVMSIQLSHGFSGVVHTWLGHTMGHHTMSHDVTADWRPQLQEIDAWYATQYASLLSKLDSVNEGNGTLLDNTLVVWGRELGNTSHAMQPWPVVLFGGRAAGLRTGRFLTLNNEPSAKLLVSIGQMMGLNISTFGDINANSGPLTQLA